MDSKIKIVDCDLFLSISGKEKTIKMPLPITQALCDGDKIFVRLKLISGKTQEQNLYCVNKEGKIIWQVQDPDLFKTGKIMSPRDFMGEIWVKPNGELWAHGTRGFDYRIDKETGHILSEVFTK